MVIKVESRCPGRPPLSQMILPDQGQCYLIESETEKIWGKFFKDVMSVVLFLEL